MKRQLAAGHCLRLAVAALALGLAACASPERPTAPETLWSSGEDYVRIEPQGDREAPPNDHPVRYTPEALRAMLGSIEVAEQRWFLGIGGADSDPEPLFLDQRLDRLGRPLSRALAEADPGEDVTFAVSGTRCDRVTGLLGSTTTTTGRVFHRDGRLHLIFGAARSDRREAIEPRAQPHGGYVSKLDRMRNPPVPGSRGEPARLDVALVPRARGMERLRADWLALEAEALREGAPQERPAGERAAGVPERPALPDGPAAGEAAEADAEPALPAVEPPRPQGEPAAVEPAGTDRAASGIEARRRRLKRLHEQGLVSDEVYGEKMRDILGEL